MEFLAEVVFPALAVIISGLATWGVVAFTNWLNTKIKNDEVKESIAEVRDIIVAAVAETSQIFVDDLKAEGLFTDAAKKEAYQATLERVLIQLTAKGKQAIESVTNDVDLWLEAEIEKAVKESKK